MSSSSSAKLVDCILALKSYHDWKQGGALGFWRLKSPNHPTGYITNTTKYFNRSKSMNGSNVSRKKWALPDQESLDDNSLTCLSTQPDVSLTFEKDIPAPFSEALQGSPFDQNDISSEIVHDEVAGNGKTSGNGSFIIGICPLTLDDYLSFLQSKILRATIMHLFLEISLLIIIFITLQFPSLPGFSTLGTNSGRFCR